MYIIITNNYELVNLARRKGEQVIDLNLIPTTDYSKSPEFNTSISGTPKDALDTDNLILETLLRLGVPTHIYGFEYLRYAINQFIHTPNYDANGIVNGVYVNIAEHFGTTSQRVERAIRHAIDLSSDRGDQKLLKEIFGFSINAKKEKATNAEFLYGVTTHLRKKLSSN